MKEGNEKKKERRKRIRIRRNEIERSSGAFLDFERKEKNGFDSESAKKPLRYRCNRDS